MYSILVVSTDEVYFADVMSDGEIIKLFADTSMVPHKMRPGGQSAHRFAQNRENAIVQWYKEINELLKEYDRAIILSINWINYKKFLSYLNTYNQAKIQQQISGEYDGLPGVYDTINRIEKEKHKTPGIPAKPIY